MSAREKVAAHQPVQDDADDAVAAPGGTPRERVLFVDDEPRVLDGLRRMLRPMRELWDMQFVGSGREALELVRNDAITVLITDMRMPDMDGAELLSLVRTESPATVRIVLSGHSDVDQIQRSIKNAHQYLAKPCSSDVLRRVITRACALRDVLGDEELKRTLSKLSTLPSPPDVYRELLHELELPDASLLRVAEVISADIAMTTRVLRLVNSAWFSLNRTIVDAHDAVLMLGTETVKTLVLSAHVFAELAEAGESSLLTEIGEHSLQVAQLARRIAFAEKVDVTMAGHAFTAGMMHEVGLMVLAVNDPKGIEECLRLVRAEDITMASAERRVWNATHAQVGAYLLGLWGMPTTIIEAVAFCSTPTVDGSVGLGHGGFTPLTAVHVADALVHERLGLRVPVPPIDRSYLGRIGLRARLDVWSELRAGGDRSDR